MLLTNFDYLPDVELFGREVVMKEVVEVDPETSKAFLVQSSLDS